MSIIIKTTAQTWDRSYSLGKWDRLDEQSVERARSAIIGMYCGQLSPQGNILDVGCGTGVLLDFLNAEQQNKYLGLDISGEAIRIAQNKRRGRFQIADAGSYESLEKFEIIVFNEVLYYLDYDRCLRKFINYLKPNGMVIVSVFRARRLSLRFAFYKIWAACQNTFKIYEHIKLSGRTKAKRLTWDIKIMGIALPDS